MSCSFKARLVQTGRNRSGVAVHCSSPMHVSGNDRSEINTQQAINIQNCVIEADCNDILEEQRLSVDVLADYTCTGCRDQRRRSLDDFRQNICFLWITIRYTSTRFGARTISVVHMVSYNDTWLPQFTGPWLCSEIVYVGSQKWRGASILLVVPGRM